MNPYILWIHIPMNSYHKLWIHSRHYQFIPTKNPDVAVRHQHVRQAHVAEDRYAQPFPKWRPWRWGRARRSRSESGGRHLEGWVMSCIITMVLYNTLLHNRCYEGVLYNNLGMLYNMACYITPCYMTGCYITGCYITYLSWYITPCYITQTVI
jgi:hypothetical protein